MKIVYFNYLYDLYGLSLGSTIKAQELMSALAKQGHDVKIYWRKKQPPKTNGSSKTSRGFLKNIILKRVKDPKHFLLKNIKYFFEELKIIAREKPDLIIARLDLYLFSALLAAKVKNIPIIIEADAPCVYETREFHPQYRGVAGLAEKIEMMNLLKSDMNFCVSSQARAYFVGQGVPEEKMAVITNGVDVHRFRLLESGRTVRDKYNLNGKTVIGFVGSFHYWHGVENLIDLLKKLVKINEDTAFMMVGDGGPLKQTLEDFIRTQKLEDRVIMTGLVSYEEIPQYISSMDLVLAPYPKLKFFYYSPVKIFEYMACEKPVITSRIGQIEEIIEDEHNGLLCEPENLEDMFEGVNSLVKNAELRERMGKNARNTIVRLHTWEEKAEQLSNLCLQAVSS